MMFWKKSLTDAAEARWGLSWPTVVLMALPAMLFASWIGRSIFSLSFRILEHQQDIGLDYAMGVLWWIILALGILALGGEARRLLIVGWSAKFLVTLLVMLFYEQYYALDSYWYYGVTVNGIIPMWPELGDVRKEFIPSFRGIHESEALFVKSQMSTENMVRSLLLISYVTGPYYHAIKVCCAFFGLLGSWWFYRSITLVLGREYPAAFYLMACFPSILFWSSILGKDPLQFFFLGLYAYGAIIWLAEGRLFSLLPLGIGILGSYMFRPWSALLEGGVLVMATVLSRCRRWQRVALAGAGLLALVGTSSLSPESLEEMLHLDPTKSASLLADPTIITDLLGERAKGVATETQGSGGTGIISGLDRAGAVNINFVEAFFAGLFRPLPFDARNPAVLLAALENTVLLILTIWAFAKLRLAYLRDPLVLWTGLYTCGWSAIYGFIVMANFGSGARYKLQMLPFFLMFLMLLIHREGRTLLESRLPPEARPTPDERKPVAVDSFSFLQDSSRSG